MAFAAVAAASGTYYLAVVTESGAPYRRDEDAVKVALSQGCPTVYTWMRRSLGG